jgi:hypothetical protein
MTALRHVVVRKCGKVQIFRSDTDRSKLNAWRTNLRLNSGTPGVIRVRIFVFCKESNIGRQAEWRTARQQKVQVAAESVTVCVKLWVTDRCSAENYFQQPEKMTRNRTLFQ